MPWLEENKKNFDLSERSAQRYMADAKYVISKSDTVADFANLAPDLLHDLTAGVYNEQEEAAILAATSEGRVDFDRAGEICDALAPPEDVEDEEDGDEDGNDDDVADDDGKDSEGEETKKILEGSPPPVPPPTPDLTPTNYALNSFDEAVRTLKQLSTKSVTTFTGTMHSTNDLENVERFIGDVSARKRRRGVE